MTKSKPPTSRPRPRRAAKTSPAAAPEPLAAFVTATLEDDKARDVVTIDLKGKSIVADALVIASGTSSRHVSALATRLRDRLAATRRIRARVEGLAVGDWVIVDAGDVVVHLFREEVRAFYKLEKLWGADFSGAPVTRYSSDRTS